MQKLKILFVSQNNVNNYAGAGKVHYELKREFEKAGHHVDIVDLSTLFPGRLNIFYKIFGIPFTRRILKYLRKNAHKYDVIDANLSTIIYPKQLFNFKGLLFARSQGILPLYIKSYSIPRFVKTTAEYERNRSIKSRIGSIVRSLYRHFSMEDFEASVKHADIVHCLNQSEYDYHLETGVDKNKLILLPNGLLKTYLETFQSTVSNRENNEKIVSIIGAWHNVKGSKDWNYIAQGLNETTDFKSIKILGSVMSEEYVKRDFDDKFFPLLTIIPKYTPEQLPFLLEKVKVGISSSYMEGLPYAVLEQLAAGIPVVGYNVPGVSDFLSQIDLTLLVEPGNIEQLVIKTIELLALRPSDYKELSKRCVEVSEKYRLGDIWPKFIEVYKEGLNNLTVKAETTNSN